MSLVLVSEQGNYIYGIYIYKYRYNMFCFISTINCIYNFNIMLLQRNVYQ